MFKKQPIDDGARLPRLLRHEVDCVVRAEVDLSGEASRTVDLQSTLSRLMLMHVKLPEHLTKLWARVPNNAPWLAFGCGLALGSVLVLAFTWEGMTTASVGLLGVLLGAAISATAGFLVALEARRAQIAAVTWSKRLEAHQKAFALWSQCWNVVHDNTDKKSEILKNAEDWWFENCLYLSEDARNSFKRMIASVHIHGQLLDTGNQQLVDDKRKRQFLDQINRNWNKIVATGQTIMEASGGHISDDVLRRLGPKGPAGQ